MFLSTLPLRNLTNYFLGKSFGLGAALVLLDSLLLILLDSLLPEGMHNMRGGEPPSKKVARLSG